MRTRFASKPRTSFWVSCGLVIATLSIEEINKDREEVHESHQPRT